MISFGSGAYERLFLRVFCAVFLHNLEDAASCGREGGLRWPSWVAGEGKKLERDWGRFHSKELGKKGAWEKNKECTKALV